MCWNRRWVGLSMIGASAWLLSGCARDLPDLGIPRESLSRDISFEQKIVARAQLPEGPRVVPNMPLLPTAPPPGFGVKPINSLLEAPPPPTDFGVKQTSLAPGKVRVRVRAWVNGRPIFDEELIQWAGMGLQEAHRDGKMTEHFNTKLDELIEQEMMYQDAVRKLEKASPHSLDKMREYVDLEFDKSLKRWRDAKMPDEQIREIEPTARRLLERNLISTEYARSRIRPMLDSVLNLTQISEYYQAHKNEFQTVDKIEWQDIFIPIGPNQTLEDVKRFGEQLVNSCLKPGDFDKLMSYNSGDSALRGGTGIGQRLGRKDPKTGEWLAGDIRPAELEEHLAKLPEGKIGPVVAFSTGVHLIRVTKREYAGQLPLDDSVQKIIRRRLESELADREYRRIVKELKTRTVVQKIVDAQ